MTNISKNEQERAARILAKRKELEAELEEAVKNLSDDDRFRLVVAYNSVCNYDTPETFEEYVISNAARRHTDEEALVRNIKHLISDVLESLETKEISTRDFMNEEFFIGIDGYGNPEVLTKDYVIGDEAINDIIKNIRDNMVVIPAENFKFGRVSELVQELEHLDEGLDDFEIDER